MLQEETWTFQIRKTSRVAGQLSAVYGLVLSSNGTVRGSIAFRGSATSTLLSLLQMSESVTVVDCSGPVRSNGRD